MPDRGSDLLDGVHADQLVAGRDRPLVHEALVAVHDPAVVDAQLRVVDDRAAGRHGEHDRERRRRHNVGVAGGVGRGDVEVRGSSGPTADGELADLLAPDLVRRRRRIGAADEGLVQAWRQPNSKEPDARDGHRLLKAAY